MCSALFLSCRCALRCCRVVDVFCVLSGSSSSSGSSGVKGSRCGNADVIAGIEVAAATAVGSSDSNCGGGGSRCIYHGSEFGKAIT